MRKNYTAKEILRVGHASRFTLGSGTDGMRHISFAGVSRAVYVWWNGSKRDANLGFDSIEWHGYRWFVFAC